MFPNPTTPKSDILLVPSILGNIQPVLPSAAHAGRPPAGTSSVLLPAPDT